MLWVGLLARDTGKPASEHLQIKDDVVALDFNLAVTHRLSRYDLEVMQAQAKRIAYEASKIFREEEEEVTYDDKYTDASTEVW